MNPFPPGTRTYTPGYFNTKLFFFAMGLLVIVLGIASIWQPLKVTINGQKASAEVIAVIIERPGEAPRTVTTKDDVKEDSAGVSIYRYRARYTTADNKTGEGMLNIAFKKHPNATIGDTYTVRFDPAKPGELIAIYDRYTWTFGCFLILAGMFQAFVQGAYLVYARKPIPIPEDTPDPDAPLATVGK